MNDGQNPPLYPYDPTPQASYMSDMSGVPKFNEGFSEGGNDGTGAIPDMAKQLDDSQYRGVYSSSGIDMITVLLKVATRPNPQINLGPVDMSASFVVANALADDLPIIYASESFETLTGYSTQEVLGRNSRFLQAPEGLVTVGSRRRYTDNNAVYNLKTHIIQKKEIQVSLVNYKKSGEAFVNLVTVIPISMHGGGITHFVGFQVDFVERPKEIRQKVQEGAYMQNEALPLIAPLLESDLTQIEPEELCEVALPTLPQSLLSEEFYQLIGVSNEEDKDECAQIWNKMLLDEADDFIHVLSLKGVFSYASTSCKTLLEYEPEELVGQSISKICEPSDLNPVMREIKEANSENDTVTMLYRAKRKFSGYMWIEATGKLFSERGKSRKYIILSGRPRPVYRLSRGIISRSSGGINDMDMWSKLSNEGMILHITDQCENLLEYPASELQQTNLACIFPEEHLSGLSESLRNVQTGTTVKLHHKARTKQGEVINLTSVFYPGNIGYQGGVAFVLCQTREMESELIQGFDSAPYEASPMPQTDEVSMDADNLFSILNEIHPANWQYEMHLLKLANRQLNEDIKKLEEHKVSMTPKKKKKRVAIQDKCCTSCKRIDSPEWRKGPEGPGTLCNSCGLKWSKMMRKSQPA
ncbi:hypothetical protein K493DRAFT_293436 [Basidiobolus meristosporus CBS 931.73]|uniref:White collar 1 protein n=1 Tax=Basidiobolus meristosporus CBS 931.73 TaxID=1314790 RepID=A0A1Y1WZG7_9FUNG|nr:hypothetical protein K493DRAFT_293436 [Basidiobolus meristosporus CBS 931.73]|eukprot:ORX78940.1 hypothetical protein K493DRAFT_293436 [Basidiobolus meristosporus CBS 931.73]